MFFVSHFTFVVALHVCRVLLSARAANLPDLQITGHVAKFQVRKGERVKGVNLSIMFTCRCLEVREGLSNQL